MDIDFGLALDFIDDRDGRPLQLRFRRNWAPADSPDIFDGTGQLIAAISRPGVALTDVEAALDGWETWAELTPETVNLAQIRRRICAAGLD